MYLHSAQGIWRNRTEEQPCSGIPEMAQCYNIFFSVCAFANNKGNLEYVYEVLFYMITCQ